MKKRVIVLALVGILAFSVGGLAGFSFEAMNTIKQDNAQLSSLNGTISALKNDMSTMRTIVPVPTTDQDVSLAQLAELVNPAVVRIDFSGTGVAGVGSGFIVDQNGYVVTNQHVIADATSIKVTMASGDSYSAAVVASDANRDLALLKITSTRTDFPVIALGSASDAAVGDALLVVGFPLGLELSGPASFTQGIVSAIRSIGGLTYIQMDAPINPGNSGGPVIGMQGTLVGVCVAQVTDPNTTVQGMGLAIPVGDLLSFIDSGKVACSSCHYTVP